MKRTNRFFINILLLAVSLACTFPFKLINTQESIATSVARTMEARASSALPTLPPSPVLPLPEVVNTATPMTILVAGESFDPCYQALLVGETVPDGSDFRGKDDFTKTWVLRNVGSCTWNGNYKFYFNSGEHMDGPNSIKLNETVAPGGQTSITVNLEAPSKTGTYVGYWRMQADNGVRFAKVWVNIDVTAAAPTTKPAATTEPEFAVTDIGIAFSQDPESGACPVTVTTLVSITTNDAGTVVFYVDFGHEYYSDEISLVFDEAGTLSYEIDWPNIGGGWPDVTVYVLMPSTDFHGTEYEVVCD